MFFWCILQIEIESSTQEKTQEEGGEGEVTVYVCVYVCIHIQAEACAMEWLLREHQ